MFKEIAENFYILCKICPQIQGEKALILNFLLTDGRIWLFFILKEKISIFCLSVSSHHTGGSGVKNPPSRAGAAVDSGLIPGSGRPSEGGNGNPLQYSSLENPMDREANRLQSVGLQN